MSPEDLGYSLKERGVDVHEIEGRDIVVRWFHSPHDCDLMVGCESGQEVSRFQINVCGQVVDWRRGHGFSTGIIVVFESDEASRLMDVERVQYDLTPNEQTVKAAIEVIQHMPVLDEQLRSQVISILQMPPVACPVVLQNGPPAARPRFWARLRLWGN